MADNTDDVREAARKRLESRRGFVPHLLVFLAVNTMLVLIWWVTSAPSFFWPIIPIAAWSIGILAHAWDAFFSKPITEEDIDRELQRWRHKPGFC